MSDPAFKLFGKTIALPSHSDQAGGGGGGDEDKGFTNNKESPTETNDKEHESANSEDKSDEPITTTTSTTDHETHQQQKPHPSDGGDDDDDDQEKVQKTDQEEQQQDDKPALKKPDKILPCPRCNSMDTKFCYYNNYNVNQPRHFCKNCQRYWTAGGTMRNVPVGAGRRKNKNAAAVAAAAAAHYRHLTMTDAAALQAIATDTIHHPALKPNETVLSFGSDAPLCDSVASVLNLAEKTMKNCSRNGFQRIEEHMEEQSTGSSAPNSNSADHEGNNGANLQEPAGVRNCQGFAPHPPYVSGSSPWPYPWNPPPPPPPGAAPFCGPSFPIPIYPATAYWGCSGWSIPWLATMQGSPSPTSTSPGSGPNAPTLGKHTREGDVLHKGSSADDTVEKQSNQEKCLWIPKTLRIDDPEEAAKSSIWATLGFSKSDKADGISSQGGGLFRSFQTKGLGSRRVEASQALHANPAALSRSINFQESS